jgi:hypothetical protein
MIEQPKDQFTCEFKQALFTINTNGKYLPVASFIDGTNWNSIVNNTTYTGATTNVNS